MSANREYKSSVFSSIFGVPETLRELYPALSGKAIAGDEKIEINTLDNVLVMEQVNDLSFTVGNRLVVLIEHQSTINPNMTLRLLLYIVSVYKKIAGNRSLYGKSKINIPAPEFFVLYNGIEEQPDRKIYKLSELFIELTGEPKLELEVTVLNVNEGHNREIMSRSETLKEYSAFVDVVRHYRNESEDLEQAMKQALGYCITHGILPEYLKEHGSEVISMLTLEWNTEDAKVVWREEGRQEGLQQGLQQGVQQGVQQGLQQGIAQARSIGIPEDTIVKIFGHN